MSEERPGNRARQVAGVLGSTLSATPVCPLARFIATCPFGNCSRCSHTTHRNISQLLTPSAVDDEVFPSPRRVHTRVPRIRAPSASVLRQAPRAPSR